MTTEKGTQRVSCIFNYIIEFSWFCSITVSLKHKTHKTWAQNPSFGLNLVLLLNKYIVFLVSCEYIIPFLDNEYIFLEAGNENEVYATK